METPRGHKRFRNSSTDTEGLQSEDTQVTTLLSNINATLTSLDARISLVEVLHKEFQGLRESLEFSQDQIESLVKSNQALESTVKILQTQLSEVKKENTSMKETILDIQARSMRDNLIFSGIAETTQESPEKTIKNFMQAQLKLSPDTVKRISFHSVHRIGTTDANSTRPRPIIAKFVHYQDKELVKRKGKELKGTRLGMNDHFPKEIQERRKALYPIRKRFIQEGKRAVIAVDKLYVDGQLYRDKNITTWL